MVGPGSDVNAEDPGAVALQATPAALALIAELCAQHGALQFLLSHGCCDGTTPMCLTVAEFQPGPDDQLVADLDGVPFRAGSAQRAWLGPMVATLDVADGSNGAFSLEDGSGRRFVLRLQPR